MPRKRQHQRGAVTLPKGVHRVIARGREYFYYQAGRGTVAQGPRLPLPKDPHLPEFWIELRKARGEQSGPVITTINAVCDLYEASPQFLMLVSETQRQYRRGIAYARKAWGNLAAANVKPVHVRGLLDGLHHIPGTANNVLGLLRALSKWGLERGHFDHPITEGVKPYKSQGGHKPWTAEQCAAAEKHLTGMVRRAYFLARYTGQRGSDVVRFGPTFIDDGGFRLSPKKTGKRIGEIWIPIEPALAAEIATWELKPGPYLQQRWGKVYGKKLLEDHFADAREKIPELAGATFHGLRGTRVVELRQRGATTTQIQDQVGMSLAMIERYCRFADRKANGKAAVLSLASARARNGGL